MNCVICGKEISKRQSFAYGEGRACKTHQEAQDEVGKRFADSQTKIRDEVAARKTASDKFEFPSLEESQAKAEHDRHHCWICDAKGLTLQEHFLDRLVGMRVLRMRGAKFSLEEFMTGKLGQEATGSAGVPRIFNVSTENLKGKGIRYRDYTLFQIASMGGFAIFCTNCIKKFNISENDIAEIVALKKTHELMDSDTLMTAAALAESQLGDTVDHMAMEVIESRKL